MNYQDLQSYWGVLDRRATPTNDMKGTKEGQITLLNKIFKTARAPDMPELRLPLYPEIKQSISKHAVRHLHLLQLNYYVKVFASSKARHLEKKSKIIAHMFWAKSPISPLESLCMRSFLRNKYELWVWTYDEKLQLPDGVFLKNANELIDESELFLNQRGSYAGFSDYFRYKVLNTFGGLYADTDVIALRKADELPEKEFLVSERYSKSNSEKIKINGNVIYCPSPSKGNVIDLAYAYSRSFRKEDIYWSEIGPALLTAIANIYPKHSFEIHPPNFANPIPWWDCPKKLLLKGTKLTEETFFIHCYNEKWRQHGVDKNKIKCHRTSIINLAFQGDLEELLQ